MDVETEGVVMFLHVALVVGGMMLAAVLHTALIQLTRADAASEMRPWVTVIRRVEPMLPLVALAIFGSGAWLIQLSDGEFAWSDAWIGTSIVALVIGEAVGALLSPRSHALTNAIGAAADGPPDADLRAKARDPLLWYGAHFVTAVFFAIIFLMSAKPTEVVGSVIVVLIGTALGLLSAAPFVHGGVSARSTRVPRRRPRPAG